MVRNEALGIVRRRKRWSLVSNLTDLFTRRLVDEFELEDTHRAVWKALRQLPTEQAEVVVLKIWEEKTFAEIGEVLDISPNTAASPLPVRDAKALPPANAHPVGGVPWLNTLA